MKTKKLILLTLVLGILCAVFYFVNREAAQQKRKESMPAAIWESSLSEESKDLFVEGTLGEKDVVFLTTEGFLEKNLPLYAKYPEIKAELCVRYVNEGILNEKNATIILRLTRDPYFIEKNLHKYLANPRETVRKTVEYVNSGRDGVFYKDIREADVSKDYLVNVNKYFRFPSTYEPQDLITIDSQYGFPGKFRKMAYDAYVAMEKDARAAGMKLEVMSAYRSYQRQVELFGAYTGISGEKEAETYSARAGFSDHQSGLAIDVLSPGYDFDTFYRSNEAKWLAENGHKYGFIIRYPQEKEEVTGYTYEPWHLRYIGKEAAKKIVETGLCYDEYYSYYVEEH